MKKRIISPSLLSANFTRLKEDIKVVENAGVTRLHLDVMDGHFVPNLTFGPFIIKDIRKITKSHLETHLMITNPHKYFDEYINAGSDTLIFHYEASTDIKRDLKYIQERGVKAGIAINPDSDYKQLLNFTDNLDYILIMSVFPGFGGQSFIESTLDSMKFLKDNTRGTDILIGVDGGVNINTIDRVYNTGIDVTIVGSGLYGAKNINKRYNELILNGK
ncbi:MAG: ribulose-phosphate 3-epimerase [Candidatus Marinimicrobia bacterium]|jgi:ribulose-phosphate 3-epimerase|nr:ribulose-phosphate 3-epimerase [Candidatus Neomarinimicrobiota bacterium]|tara:strand:- start:1301 stop:1954 length:654 start_codon:yes stop_codon:yes gene_type:complete